MENILTILLTYLKVFAVGGLACLIAQLLIIKTKVSPARILVSFLILGIILETLGVYKYIFDFAKAGISIPIIGFGATLAKGAIEMAKQFGFAGAFAGGLSYTAYGLGVAVVISFVITLMFSSKTKK